MAGFALIISCVTLVALLGIAAVVYMWVQGIRGFIEDVLVAEIRRYDDRTRKRIEKMAGNLDDAAGMPMESMPESLNGLVPGQPYKVR
jgi:hypothetical protein